MTYRTTPIAVAIHVDDESPIFGEQTIQVWIDNEAAGPLVVLKQIGHNSSKPGTIWLDIEQLETVTRAARELSDAQPGERGRE